MHDYSDLLPALLDAATFAVPMTALLLVSYLVLDLQTPGHLGTHLTGDADAGRAPSWSAAVVTAAWVLSSAAIVFTAIWTNAEGASWSELAWTTSFAVFGLVLKSVVVLAVDLLTPGRLRQILCEPGPAQPVAVLTASLVVAVSLVVVASIA